MSDVLLVAMTTAAGPGRPEFPHPLAPLVALPGVAAAAERARDALAAHLREAGIPTAQYYPKPLHKQTAYESFPVGAGGLKVSEAIAHRVLALPMHPYLDGQTQTKIANAIRDFAKAGG